MAADAEAPAPWDVAEDNYCRQMEELQRKQLDAITQEYNTTTEPLKLELVNLYGERTRLARALQDVRLAVEKSEELLHTYTVKFTTKTAQMAEERQHAKDKARDWFAQMRRGKKPTLPESGADVMAEGESRPRVNCTGPNSAVTRDASEPYRGLASRARSTTAGGSSAGGAEEMGVGIYDHDGNLIHQLQKISLRNPWIEDVLGLSVQRPISVRADHLLTPSDLASIYDGDDNKGGRWIGCMIQAAGKVQAQPCDACRQQGRPFLGCVRVTGENFPRCGNCEWNCQSCYQGSVSQPAPDRRTNPGQGIVDGGPAPTVTGADEPYRSLPAPPPSDAVASQARPGVPRQDAPSTAAMGKKQWRSLPEGKAGKAASKPSTPVATPGASEQSFDLSDGKDKEEKAPIDHITKDTLSLVHDGMVFLEPEIMRGVPVHKITPDHAYWDPKWRSIEDMVRPKLEHWTERFNGYKHRNLTEDKHARYLAGRQVNRGTTTMNFLRDGSIHPYQIVAKDFITQGMSNYDTMHRMIATLEELAKFTSLDVTPLQWLRQRLHERYTENPGAFKLEKVLHNLYHDPKLVDLRALNGFGNIGRPSVRADGTARKRAPASESKKRKEPPTSARSTPKKRSPEEARMPSANHLAAQNPPPLGTSPRASLRKEKGAQQQPSQGAGKAEVPAYGKGGLPLDPDAGDLDYDGYTTADSFSMDRVTTHDWRIHQVKTPTRTSNFDITQYWHWIDGDGGGSDGEPMLEHQVLKEVEPPDWGVYKEPIDFHLRMREIKEMQHTKGEKRIVVVTKKVSGVVPRGLVLVQFKRERTKRRFLSFMEKKGVKLVRTTV